MNSIDYFNSKQHIINQSKKLLSLINKPLNEDNMSITIDALKKNNIELFNMYYRKKPRNMNDSIFLNKLSIKSIYDTAPIVNQKFKNIDPYNHSMHNNYNVNNNYSKDTFRTGELQQRQEPVQPISYSQVVNNTLGQPEERPNEAYIMSIIQEDPKNQYVKNSRQLQNNNQQQINNNNNNNQPYNNNNIQYNNQQFNQSYNNPPQYNQQQINNYNQSNQQIPQQLPQQMQQQTLPSIDTRDMNLPTVNPMKYQAININPNMAPPVPAYDDNAGMPNDNLDAFDNKINQSITGQNL